jgi:hypothetical protein
MACGTRTLTLVALSMLLAACNTTTATSPFLAGVNGAASPTGPVGSTVVLRGVLFGDTQGTGRVLFTPGIGGVPHVATVASPGDWSTGAIATTVPAGLSGTTLVTVEANSGGLSNAVFFTVTPAVSFDPSAVTWTAGPDLPSALSGAAVASAQVSGAGYVYAVGGAAAGGAPVKTVSYAGVDATGTVGTWTATTDLPVALEFATAVVATPSNSAVISNGFLYVLGGATSAAGAPVATVYRAPLNTNGSLGSWTSITALPAPLRSVGAIVLFGSMYVVGGATTGNVPVATVYRAPVQVAGTINSWLPQTGGGLPAPRSRFGFGASGLYLYVVGGDNASLTPNDSVPSAAQVATIFYNRANLVTADVTTSWTTATTTLPAARSAHSAVLRAGNVLLTGGLYSGATTNTSEEAYAQVNADGTVGSFTTATPAASISSLCSCSLFNQGGTGYLAGNGSFHVLIVGGDNAATPGTPQQKTFTY